MNFVKNWNVLLQREILFSSFIYFSIDARVRYTRLEYRRYVLKLHPTCRQRFSHLYMASMGLIVVAVLLLSACGASQMQQQAQRSKAVLDTQILYARKIGVPAAMLQPVLRQVAQLNATGAPLTLFTTQPADQYYTNLSQRYQVLTLQVRGLESQATGQLAQQAKLDILNFTQTLARRQAQHYSKAIPFVDRLTQEQRLLANAKYPKDFQAISTNAQEADQQLHLMKLVKTNIALLQQQVAQMKALRLDTTALDRTVQNDVQLYHLAATHESYTALLNRTNTQLQLSTVTITQAIPYAGAAKLVQFRQDIALTKSYGLDVSSFQQRLLTDQSALAQAKTVSDYLNVSKQIDADTASIQLPMLQGQANSLLKQFHQEVTGWGSTHKYHDTYNGVSYSQDFSYDQQGIGSDLDTAVQSAQTVGDYQSAIQLLQNDYASLKAMEADSTDKTAWNQPHATDLQMINTYHLSGSEVVVVSLVEQTMRMYDSHGNLIKAFQVTTGQYAKPTPPGQWQIILRESPTVFKSSEPPGSPYWYPPTPITYAMEFHYGGYFFHDSWWRVNYGSGTQFPHYDTGGDESFAGVGSHGCVNMAPAAAAWMYANTGYGLNVIIY